jgi:predicted cupin superfamily sugar epimerase
MAVSVKQPVVAENGIALGAQPDLAVIRPAFVGSDGPENSRTLSVIKALGLIPHIEGGYFLQTDASPISIPWRPEGSGDDDTEQPLSQHTVALTGGIREGLDPSKRRLSTTIFYFITPRSPLGSFHRNRNRIVHTLHRGRGRYVLIHPDGRIETFVVGQDIVNGERLQWVVEGGVWKASFLLPMHEGGDADDEEGLLISETVVPGFEYIDHEFLTVETSQALLTADTLAGLEWLVRKEHK